MLLLASVQGRRTVDETMARQTGDYWPLPKLPWLSLVKGLKLVLAIVVQSLCCDLAFMIINVVEPKESVEIIGNVLIGDLEVL